MNAFSAQNGSLAANPAADDADDVGAKENPPRRSRRAGAPDAKSKKSRPMHRISTVRQRQGVSLRSVARQLRIDVRRLRAQEDESADLMLSTLYQWQKVLD